MTVWSILRETIAMNRRLWLTMTLGFALLYHFGLLAAATISTGHLPNYVTFYDWTANVLRIVRSTPSVTDMLPIIDDEWLVEIGAMNYHYGHGIAEWSLAVVPSHSALTILLAALVATCLLLLRRMRRECPLPERAAGASATVLGALCTGTANITMTWVACCSTPSWVAGLSLVGIETSSAFALLPYGNALSASGLGVLAGTTWFLARRCVRPPPRELRALPKRLAMQDR